MHAVEQLSRDHGLVLLTSDDDVNRQSSPTGILHDSAAADLEEGFDLAATGNPASSLLQVAVRKGAPLAGQSIRAVGFRGRFQAAVIAVKRAKSLQPGRLGDIVLQPRDVLVLSTATNFDPTAEEFRVNFEKCACCSLTQSCHFAAFVWPLPSFSAQHLLAVIADAKVQSCATRPCSFLEKTTKSAKNLVRYLPSCPVPTGHSTLMRHLHASLPPLCVWVSAPRRVESRLQRSDCVALTVCSCLRLCARTARVSRRLTMTHSLSLVTCCGLQARV